MAEQLAVDAAIFCWIHVDAPHAFDHPQPPLANHIREKSCLKFTAGSMNGRVMGGPGSSADDHNIVLNRIDAVVTLDCFRVSPWQLPEKEVYASEAFSVLHERSHRVKHE